MTSEQTEFAVPDAFQVLVFARSGADGVAAHLGGHMTADAGVQVTGTAFAHGSDDLMGRKDAICALTTQSAGDSKNFITASHASILPDLPVLQ